MALEKGTEEFVMFGDFFNICKKYWDVKNTDEYWENLISELGKFIENYKEIELSREIALAFSNAQERKGKRKE